MLLLNMKMHILNYIQILSDKFLVKTTLPMILQINFLHQEENRNK